jgi:hypothetical protein
MGIVPAYGLSFRGRRSAAAAAIPEVYHGGIVMSGQVTVHTVFWAPAGHSFPGSPSLLVAGYEGIVQKFMLAAAHDSGKRTNVFSALYEYPDASAYGDYQLHYLPASDSLQDGDPYPPVSKQCVSPLGIATCVTGEQVEAELRRVIATRDPGGATQHDVWLLFLPGDVDECTSAGVCGTNAYLGYHALAPGPAPLLYAVIIDPEVELPSTPGTDPEGNPDAEGAVNTAAHELVESISDPEGTGWMDPNGYEVADKCEEPEYGVPLGYALDGSPFNQWIDGEQWLVQEMWSNAAGGCVQRSSATLAPVSEPVVRLRQYSPQVSGRDGSGRAGLAVQVRLIRAGRLVAVARGATRAGGAWGPLRLRGRGGALHGVGDDREIISVLYGPGGPAPEVIETGSGGNPFTESGWTGWGDLDTGYRVTGTAVRISPCVQTGVLTLGVDGRATAPPISDCNTNNGVATVRGLRLGSRSQLTFTSEDNRAATELDPSGALVAMTVALGEPGAVGSVGNQNVPFAPSGQPLCTAELATQTVRCSGLVPGERYVLERARGRARRAERAGGGGTISIAGLPGRRRVRGGDRLTLLGSGGRVLTVLHVARLRVVIDGRRATIAAGSCQPGDYWGPAPNAQPTGPAVGSGGEAGRGRICPLDGRAGGLPAGAVEQRDDLGGGFTLTRVPLIQSMAPANDAIVYGGFTALAHSRAAGVTISLSISPAGSGRAVFAAADVDSAGGVAVPALAKGIYDATWTLHDANGDERVVRGQFVEQG